LSDSFITSFYVNSDLLLFVVHVVTMELDVNIFENNYF